MELKFSKSNWNMDSTGAVWLNLQLDKDDIPMARRFVATQEKPHTAVLKPFRVKRSLDANAYFWTLIHKLSEKVRIPPVDIYRMLIKDIGGNCEIIPIRNDAVDKWKEQWESRGVGWVCEVLRDSKFDGYTTIINYYGSSTYDTAAMSRLIELIVQECKTQGIETLTPDELARLEGAWDARTNKSTGDIKESQTDCVQSRQ